MTLFNIPMNMFFSSTKAGLKVTAKVPQVTLGQLIPAAKGTAVDDVVLKNLAVTKDTGVMFKGTADLTKLLGSSLEGELATVETRVTLDKEKGSTFEASLKNVSISGMGALSSAKAPKLPSKLGYASTFPKQAVYLLRLLPKLPNQGSYFLAP